ncbi:hypothetical protein [Martelella radicis]|uniref:Uncharacterized protein n=1 Tax=Martelella radicis TaxID=1397476 RepID=A0A7W6KFP9_9HYPH|nr:hypothetical protein [Martelella radicis]MBB4120408.1 hypothetical protein [Martelella radicis]
MSGQPSDIPLYVSVAEIEKALDRLAEEIVARGDKAVPLLDLYAWMEGQLEKRRQNRSIFEAARERIAQRHVSRVGGQTDAG